MTEVSKPQIVLCSRCGQHPAIAAGCATWDGPVCMACSYRAAPVSPHSVRKAAERALGYTPGLPLPEDLEIAIRGLEEQHEVVRQNCLDAEANYLKVFDENKRLLEQLEAAQRERDHWKSEAEGLASEQRVAENAVEQLEAIRVICEQAEWDEEGMADRILTILGSNPATMSERTRMDASSEGRDGRAIRGSSGESAGANPFDSEQAVPVPNPATQLGSSAPRSNSEGGSVGASCSRCGGSGEESSPASVPAPAGNSDGTAGTEDSFQDSAPASRQP